MVFRNNYCDFSKIYSSFNSRFRYMLSEQFDLEYHFYGIAFFLSQYRQLGGLQDLPMNMIEIIFSFLSETPFNNVHTETKNLSKKNILMRLHQIILYNNANEFLLCIMPNYAHCIYHQRKKNNIYNIDDKVNLYVKKYLIINVSFEFVIHYPECYVMSMISA